jgi:hypothetical protein
MKYIFTLKIHACVPCKLAQMLRLLACVREMTISNVDWDIS